MKTKICNHTLNTGKTLKQALQRNQNDLPTKLTFPTYSRSFLLIDLTLSFFI